MKVAIRTDGSHIIGFGHLYRCLALAGELLKRGHVPVLVTKIFPETSEALMSCGFDIVPLKPECAEDEEINGILSVGADVIIVDILDTSQNYMKYLKQKCKFLLSIDDNGPGAHVADKVVNILYSRISGPNVISDLSYAMLREQFVRAQKGRDINPSAKKILVMQGAADTRGIMDYALEKMEAGNYNIDVPVLAQGKMLGHATAPAEGGEYEVTVIAGPAFRKIPEARKGVRILQHVENIHGLMLGADIAITAAGMSLLELLCLGTPTITLCAERFEEETAQRLEDLGATINLGFGPYIQPHTIRNAVESLAKDFEKRERMREIGQKLVDGKGAQRVADLIEDGIK